MRIGILIDLITTNTFHDYYGRCENIKTYSSFFLLIIFLLSVRTLTSVIKNIPGNMTQVFIITSMPSHQKNSLFFNNVIFFSLKLGFSLMDDTNMHLLHVLSFVTSFPWQHNAYF